MRALPSLLALAAPLLAFGQAHHNASLLDAMRDGDRPVLLFAGPHDPRIATQYTELLDHATELRARQMRIVLVTRSPTPGNTPPPAGTVSATTAEADTLRRRFHVAPGTFTLILVGKDGGEKFRSPQPVSFQTLRTLVDAMPMRQQEMRPR